jgi:CRP/FNR family cyclic AMP-dependent transcriptional regulator
VPSETIPTTVLADPHSFPSSRESPMLISRAPWGAFESAGRIGTLRLLMATQSTLSPVIRLGRGETAYGSYGLDDSEPGVYFIEQGFVKVVAYSREGKECLLGIFTVGDIVGDLGLRSECRSESAVTMTAARLRRMSGARLTATLQSNDLWKEFIRYLADRVYQQQRLIADFVTADSEYRLAAVLMHLANRIGQPNGPLSVLNVRITHEELSAMVGTTRSRVGLFLHRFVQFGAVLRRRDGALTVHLELMEKLMDAVIVARDQRFKERPSTTRGIGSRTTAEVLPVSLTADR